MKLTIAFATAVVIAAASLSAQNGAPKILSVDHKVTVKSIVPAIAGQPAQIYVRERVADGMKNPLPIAWCYSCTAPARPLKSRSTCRTLITAGWHSWRRMASTCSRWTPEGYGRSSRPAPMNDPCNLSDEQQKQFVPTLIPAPCKATYPGQLTTIASDWHDIDAVVDHIRKLRNVQKVSMVAWSLGGPRAGGYAAQHPDKVSRLVLLAPAYNREATADAPALPRPGTVFNTQSRSEFDANWDRQVGCENQVDPKVREVVWTEMVASDPTGAKWGTGVRRAPSTTTWGFNQAMISGMKIPTLMIAGAHDKQVPPDRVRTAYDDIGSTDKVLIDLGCSSHNAMWEANHLTMFNASLEWLKEGTVSGKRNGVLRLGFPKTDQ
jgi:pimeloyl-ACP methyl ester carboxylesterase